MSGIQLSKKHGVNASIDHCGICGKEIGLILFGKLPKDEKAPMNVSSGNLCEDCLKVVQQDGCVIIEVRDEEPTNNPYRTGRLVGITKEAKEQLNIPNHAAFMPKSIFDKVFGNAIKEEHETD